MDMAFMFEKLGDKRGHSNFLTWLPACHQPPQPVTRPPASHVRAAHPSRHTHVLPHSVPRAHGGQVIQS